MIHLNSSPLPSDFLNNISQNIQDLKASQKDDEILSQKAYHSFLSLFYRAQASPLSSEELRDMLVHFDWLTSFFSQRQAFSYLEELYAGMLKTLKDRKGFEDKQVAYILELGKLEFKRAETATDAFGIMHYYGKAFRLAQEARLDCASLLEASIEPFALVLLHHFKRQAETKSDDGLALLSLLDHFDNLKSYFVGQTGTALIRQLFCLVEEVIHRALSGNHQPYTPDIKIALLDRIASGKRFCQISTACYPLERYWRSLVEFRSQFTQAFTLVYQQFLTSHLKVEQTRAFQKEQTQKFYTFIRQTFLQDARLLLGSPPGGYDIRVMGSLAREEATPYSDLELMVLIEDEKDRSYFQLLLQLVDLQITSLGETGAGTLIPGITKGFCLDDDGNPGKASLANSLIRTPKEMAKHHLNADEGVSLSYTLFQSVSLESNRDTLFQDYQTKMQEILGRLSLSHHPRKVCEAKALLQLKKREEEYLARYSTALEGRQEVDIKEDFISLFYYLIHDLALYFGKQEINTLDLIDNLQELFSEDNQRLLKQMITALWLLRARLHLHYGERKERVAVAAQSLLNCALLTSKEKEILSQTYWLVLRPLYTRLKEGFQLTQVLPFLPESLLEGIAKCTPFVPFVKSMATYLIDQDTSSENHQRFYHKLSQKISLEPLREHYIQVLEKREKPLLHALLAPYPNRDGYRQMMRLEQEKLAEALEAMTLLSPPQGSRQVGILRGDFKEKRYLKPGFIDCLLDGEGNIRKAYPDSLHNVCQAGGLHFKQKPSHPMQEYAIYSLAARLCGRGVPPSDLLRFEVQLANGQKISYPVLVSQTVEGRSLQEVLAHNPRQRLDPKSLTHLLLLSLLTRPGDGRAANFVVNDKDEIFSVDNDVSFVEPIVKEGWNRKIHFCSILYCLESQALDVEALTEWTTLSAELLLGHWIADLIEREKRYLALFPKEAERQQLYEDKKGLQFTPSLILPAGTAANLYTQLIFLQKELKAKTIPLRQPLDLLAFLINLRENESGANAIGARLQDAYKRACEQVQHPKERLERAIQRGAGPSLTTPQALHASVGKVPTAQDIEKRERYSLDKLQQEFMAYFLRQTHEGVQVTEQPGKVTLEVNFSRLTQEGQADRERQALLLKGLHRLFTIQDLFPQSITLTHVAALTQDLLALFLHKELTYLDIRYSSLEMLSNEIENCEQLEELYLSGCSQLRNVENVGLIYNNPLKLPHLTRLHIARCDQLVSLQVEAPLLQEIKANKNPRLAKINLKASLKTIVNLDDSPQVRLKNIQEAHRLPPLIMSGFGDKQFCKELAGLFAFTLKDIEPEKQKKTIGGAWLNEFYQKIGEKAITEVLGNIPSRAETFTELDLGYRKIGDRGAQALAAVLPYTLYSSFSLQRNEIGDAGARALTDVLPLTKLSKLYLADNKIGYLARQALKSVAQQNNIRISFIPRYERI